jgi:hypothetical protein
VLKGLLQTHPFLRDVDAYPFAGRWYKTWGLVFPEETAWRAPNEGWAFVNAFSGQPRELAFSDRLPKHAERAGKRRKKR